MSKIEREKLDILLENIKTDFKYFRISERDKFDHIIGICKLQQTVIKALVERAFEPATERKTTLFPIKNGKVEETKK